MNQKVEFKFFKSQKRIKMEYYSKPKNTISYTCDWYDKYLKIRNEIIFNKSN